MNSNVMSERMSERLSESMAEICRCQASRFGNGSTVSSQLTRFGVKALPDEKTVVEPPAWIGREVTDDHRYKNNNLATHPFSEW